MKVEAQHYEQAIAEARRQPWYIDGIFTMNWLINRAAELADAGDQREQEKSK